MFDGFIFQEPEPKKARTDFFATIAGIFSDGVSLNIGGAVTSKHYLVNTGCTYKVGDTVKVLKINDTYIVEYVIGKTGK